MAERIQLNGVSVYSEVILGFAENTAEVPLVVSYFDRSQSNVKSFGANMSVCKEPILCNKRCYSVRCHQYDTYVQPVTNGKEKFHYGLSMERTIGTNYLLIDRLHKGEMIYDWLMHTYELPLLAEWGETIAKYLEYHQYIRERSFLRIADGCVMPVIPINGRQVPMDQIDVYAVNLTQKDLNNLVSELLSDGKLQIAAEPQAQLCHTDVDGYFQRYGASVVANLQKQICPLVEKLDGEAHDFTLNTMRLYPQQIVQLNGDVALLEHGNYAIVNHGMGTGKTIGGAAVCESFFVRRWLRMHPGCTLKDAYEKDGLINYRVIIMCPGHLVQKWHDEIMRQIPMARATIINDFSQLLRLREKGKNASGKEFYVISRDFSKLRFQSEPTPVKRRISFAKLKRCKDCDSEFSTPGPECPNCHSKRYELRRTAHKVLGMVCPHCNNVLLPYKFADIAIGGDGAEALDYDSFTAARADNSNCFYCGEPLWQPHVSNYGAGPKKNKWLRLTHYANKTHKGRKTVWMHRDYVDEYLSAIGEEALNILEPEKNPGVRKYAPAEFIKRYMKGYFDIAIFDEAQDLKGGTTGQGHAMHCLVRSSKKQLVMTGTIAGGYANHLFYTLFRLDPRRMIDRGFTFESELAFSEKYGNVEKTFLYENHGNGEYNSCCKGRQRSTPKVKPGISPMIFLDFLLDKTTFLDLSDMSRHLPELKELVVSIPAQTEAEQQMMKEYRDTVDTLRKSAKDKAAGGFGILSKCLQFSLSYPDKPYGVDPIVSPRNGAVIAVPENILSLSGMEWDDLSSKEKKLVEIVQSEISAGRGVVVYAEYTRSPETCVVYRLQEILERYCDLKDKVSVLESTSPVASKREEWMHQKAEQGTKVFITNPRCVATGLDFCWEKDGVVYNYPTLIFYQLGYSLFVTWQASRRAWRLNQRKPCKTIYMAWSGTVQEAVISLIAEKQVATAAIQGHFSAEGLAAMAQGVDTRIKLAAALADMDSITGNGLQDMFDVLDTCDADESMCQYKPMLLYEELVGKCTVPDVPDARLGTAQIDLFDLFGKTDMQELQSEDECDNDTAVSQATVSLTVVQSSVPSSITLVRYQSSGRSAKKIASGQLALF